MLKLRFETALSLLNPVTTLSNFLNAWRSMQNREAPRTERPAHTHAYIFGAGESQEEQEKWLGEVQKILNLFTKNAKFRPIIKDGKPGYEFGFDDLESYAAFHLKVIGDAGGPESQRHILASSDAKFLAASRIAAEQLLSTQGIKYKLEAKGKELVFKFDRFSDRLFLARSVENGTLDALVVDIEMRQSQPTRYWGLD